MAKTASTGKNVSTETPQAAVAPAEPETPVLDYGHEGDKPLDECTIVKPPQKNTFRSVGSMVIDGKQCIARAMVPLELLMSKNIDDLKTGGTAPIFTRTGNHLVEVGNARISKSGKAVNCFIFRSLITMPLAQYESLLDPHREIKSVSISTPEEDWFPPQYVTRGDPRAALGSKNYDRLPSEMDAIKG